MQFSKISTNSFRSLENNWEKILEEALSVTKIPENMQRDRENLIDTGDWSKFHLFRNGAENKTNCRKAPFTCSLIRDFTRATTHKKGQVSKFLRGSCTAV